eukprot:2163374-Pleurochrysis_carterae.AAC.1
MARLDSSFGMGESEACALTIRSRPDQTGPRSRPSGSRPQTPSVHSSRRDGRATWKDARAQMGFAPAHASAAEERRTLLTRLSCDEPFVLC